MRHNGSRGKNEALLDSLNQAPVVPMNLPVSSPAIYLREAASNRSSLIASESGRATFRPQGCSSA